MARKTIKIKKKITRKIEKEARNSMNKHTSKGGLHYGNGGIGLQIHMSFGQEAHCKVALGMGVQEQKRCDDDEFGSRPIMFEPTQNQNIEFNNVASELVTWDNWKMKLNLKMN